MDPRSRTAADHHHHEGDRMLWELNVGDVVDTSDGFRGEVLWVMYGSAFVRLTQVHRPIFDANGCAWRGSSELVTLDVPLEARYEDAFEVEVVRSAEAESEGTTTTPTTPTATEPFLTDPWGGRTFKTADEFLALLDDVRARLRNHLPGSD